MFKSLVNAFSKLATVHALGSIPYNYKIISKGGPTNLLLFLSSIISMEGYAQVVGRCFLYTGDVVRPGTNSM